jgi:hypothetical protein
MTHRSAAFLNVVGTRLTGNTKQAVFVDSVPTWVGSDRHPRREWPNPSGALQDLRSRTPAEIESILQGLLSQRIQHGNQTILLGVLWEDAASLQGQRLPVMPFANSPVNPPECGGQPSGQGICRCGEFGQVKRLFETLAIRVQVGDVEFRKFAGQPGKYP